MKQQTFLTNGIHSKIAQKMLVHSSVKIAASWRLAGSYLRAVFTTTAQVDETRPAPHAGRVMLGGLMSFGDLPRADASSAFAVLAPPVV